jgi:RNA polymerase sigma-70 factor (ECF subfamily)
MLAINMPRNFWVMIQAAVPPLVTEFEILSDKILTPEATISIRMQKAQARVQLGATNNALPLDWSALLAEHERWLRTVVYARLAGAEGVDEVLQEVALAAIRQQAPLHDPSKVAPWLYRLAVIQSLLYRRRQGRGRKLIDRFVLRQPPPEHDVGCPDPLAWLLADERHRLVRQAIASLATRDAEILMLKYTEDWNYCQLAERLGISHSAVETRLHRARARLRTELLALNVIEVR